MTHQTFPLEEHQLPIEKIDSDALYVMEKLRAHGYTAYLVGGSVRDLLLGRSPKDFDISTSAEPEQIKKIFRNCILIGRRFRLAHIRFGKKILEVSTFRSGDTETDALIIRDNSWGNEEEDAKRRDFTINGLFYDSSNQMIIDYVGGYPDIQKKVLRTIGQPFYRFRQDPVRMLRLLKFQARFGLDVEPATRIALLESRQEITKSSPARIQEEILRMLESGASESFFRLMTEHGMIHLMLPAFGEYMESAEGEEVYAYLKEVDTTFHEPPRPLLPRPVLLACLIYPLMEKRIQIRYLDREKIPHLGEIAKEANDHITEMFHPFFNLSRRLRGALISILTSQYRITPIEKKKHRRIRVPNDPDFDLGMKFFEVRCSLEPALQVVWEEWTQAIGTPPTEGEPHPRPRRRRRRRRSGPRKEES
ncbi:MAG: polynucleotide adenylyltransferase PcnB [Verrucomicrobia bacterium]|nr:polynucleotide adenylyltransferase PcnB [Verrucomicrobiota bacterium]